MTIRTILLTTRRMLEAAGIYVLVAGLVGCGSSGHPGGSVSAYESGYGAGFAEDSEYHLGFDDSLYTVGAAPILYQGGEIPFIDDFSFDAGYYDGVFAAYNDGYFVAYKYAFIIGFSEGYDNAYWSDYLDFLASDFHIEYSNGGFSDGYEDGFSEGRVFGAYDYEVFLPFDWLDALYAWESGTDIYFSEVGVGTGDLSPATYYEWGTDPNLLRSADARSSLMRTEVMELRPDATRTHELSIERPMTLSQEAALDQTPLTTPRTDRELTLFESWLERIQAYSSVQRTESSARTAQESRDSGRVKQI